MTKIKLKSALLISCAFMTFPTFAFAQENKAENQDDIIIADIRTPEIIIISEHRAYVSVQNVPSAISVLNGGRLEQANIRKAQDLVQIVPALQFPQSENSLSVTARIRGIGTQGTNVGLEPSVGIIIDNVYRSRTAAGFGDLGQISMIEVARGPQSTIIGHNTSAGVINVLTTKPNFRNHYWAEIGFGNLDLKTASASINGAIIDEKLAGSFYGTIRQRDGYVNVNPGQNNARKDNSQDYYLLRGQLLFQPNDDTEIRIIGDYAQRSDSCCNGIVYIPDSRVGATTTSVFNYIASLKNNGSIGLLSANQFANLNSITDRSFNQKIFDKGLSIELNSNFDFGQLTSITSYRDWSWAYNQDGEWSGIDVLYRDLSERPGSGVKTFTQEMRLHGETGQFDWMFGGFYSNETIDNHYVFKTGSDYEAYIGALLSGTNALNLSYAQLVQAARTSAGTGTNPMAVLGGGASDYYVQNGQSFSVFTHNIYNFSDDLRLAFGLRYNHELKTFSAVYETNGNPGCSNVEATNGLNASSTICLPWERNTLDNLNHTQKFSDDKFSGVVNLAYQISDNINSYVSYSHGLKAGGFNLDRVYIDKSGSVVSGAIGNQIVRGPDTSFPAETVDSYEFGLKTKWDNIGLVFNLAIFKADYKNFQLNTYNGISQVVASVPEVNSQGYEIDYDWNTPIEGLSISGGLAYNDTTYTRNLGSPADSNSFLGQNLNLYLIAGQQLTASPKWTQATTISYRKTIVQGIFRANLDYRHTSSYNGGSNLDPRKSVGELDLFNGQINWSPNDTIEIGIWGKNLTDEHYAQIMFDGPVQGNSPLMATNGTTRAITSQINGFPAEPKTIGITLRIYK